MSWGDQSSSHWDDAPSASFAFESDHAFDTNLVTTKAPVVWLWLGLSAAVGSLLLGLFGNAVWFWLLGWVLGGLVAISLLGVFFVKDVARSSIGWPEYSRTADVLRFLLVGIALLAIVLNSWLIADMVARL